MWKLYAGTDKAVAIQSTFRRLQQAVAYAAVGVGVVRYIDDETGRTHVHPFYGPYMHKRLWYQDEHEVRAIVYNKTKRFQMVGLPYRWTFSRVISCRTFKELSAIWSSRLATFNPLRVRGRVQAFSWNRARRRRCRCRSSANRR